MVTGRPDDVLVVEHTVLTVLSTNRAALLKLLLSKVNSKDKRPTTTKLKSARTTPPVVLNEVVH